MVMDMEMKYLVLEETLVLMSMVILLLTCLDV